MKIKANKRKFYRDGSALALIAVSLVILSILGVGLLTVAYGVRHQAITAKNEQAAILAAEAGYEQAIFWMSQQQDLLTVLQQKGTPSDTISFGDNSCDYTISFYSFIGSRPIYRVVSNGHSGTSDRTVDVLVVQAMEGWGSSHRVPSGPSSTVAWPFAGGEVIDIPIHINKHDDDPDGKDIYIIGSPDFRQSISMGESRYTAGGTDKYSGVMHLFDGGICFNQPDCKITDASAVQQKVDRFADTTDSNFKFTPAANAPVTRPNAATQLEFFVEDGVGKVRITNNCTVRGYRYEDNPGPKPTYDYKINNGIGDTYIKYNTYAYHLKPTGEPSVTVPIEDTYVTQSFGEVESEPGGQIFVNGNVIIGGDNSLHNNDQAIKGKITVVATGNIWIADSIKVDGDRDGAMPAANNPNTLGLVAQGVVKVVDPGMSDYSYVDDTPVEPEGFNYVPVARPDGATPHRRKLLRQTEVEAAITVGGGGWGAENVGNRKTISWLGYDELIIRGTITEALRGIVGTASPLWSGMVLNGYTKDYYLDKRLLQGILPGDFSMVGKYIPAPGGWRDY